MKRNINDILDECVDAIKRKEKTVEECLRSNEDRRSELEPMLIASSILIENSGVVPDAKSKQETRDRLLAVVEKKRWEASIERVSLNEGTPGDRRWIGPANSWRRMFRRMVIVMAATGLLSGTTLAMAQESLPGSILYPVKLAVEKARIALAKDKDAKSKLYIEAAQERMSELRRMKKDDAHHSELVKVATENIKAAERILDGKVDKRLRTMLDDLKMANQRDGLTVIKKSPVKAKPSQRLRNSKNPLKGDQSDRLKMEPVKGGKSTTVSTVNKPAKQRLVKPADIKQESKNLVDKDQTNNGHKNESQTDNNPADSSLPDEGPVSDGQLKKHRLDKRFRE